MILKVPFDPSEGFIDYINKIDEVRYTYFSYPGSILPSARQSCTQDKIDQSLFKERLLSVDKRITKYLTINGMFSDLALYSNREVIDKALECINVMCSDGAIDGLIVYDMYLISAWALYSPDSIKDLNIIPSVNFKLDSVTKTRNTIDMFSSILKKEYVPEIITVDRSLNRNTDEMHQIKQAFPLSKISTLVNEGCLSNCVFKNTHDALISFFNTQYSNGHGAENLNELNCHSIYSKDPGAIFKIPLIRPEDTDLYKDVDVFKVAGRQLDLSWKKMIIDAYVSKRFDYNMLNLLEVTGAAKYGDIPIDNEVLGAEKFAEHTMNCKYRCHSCTYCADIASKIMRNK